jgi:hypothetical protein
LSENIFENLTEGNLVGSINSGEKLVNTNQGWVKCSYPNTNGTETPILYKTNVLPLTDKKGQL